jgi:hypothetical protein
MANVLTPVRALQLGDVILSDDQPPCAVLSAVATDPGHVVLTLGMIGPLPQPDLPRAINVRWCADAKVHVQRLDLTPAQAVADQLLAAARAHADMLEALRKEKGLTYEHTNVGYVAELVALNALLEPLGPPPPPPSVEEIVKALADVVNKREGADKAATDVLDRARRAGVWSHA